MAESGIQTQTRLEAARAGKLMFRNNSGAFQDPSGRWVRFGLGNDSVALNKEFKSPDLIGVSPYLVTERDFGRVVGIATAFEIKHGNWFFTGDERETAQENFMREWRKHGGFAGFVSHQSQIHRICSYETR